VTRVLALDVGTSSVRAHVFESGAKEEGEPARRDYAGESDADALVRATREALDEARGRADDATAVGASCFGHSLLALDGRGRPLTPILGWRDTRSAESADWLSRTLDVQAVHARTGCPIHTSFWPAKLAWLAETEPDVFRAAKRFVSFADYLYAQLIGADEIPVSVSLASGTGLLDLRKTAWDGELLGTLGVDETKLSPISDEPVGEWHPARIDGACSNLGAGCTGRTRAALMVGTSGALRTLYDTDLAQPRPGLFLYRLDARRVVEGGALSDGGNLYKWVRATLQEPRGSLAGRDPGAHGLTFLTMLGGERSPGWHQHVRGAIHGLTFETTTLDLLQAALEGVGFRFADVLDLMPEVEDVVATGGALLKDVDWCQIMADALARPIVASRVEEASLRGAAVVVFELLGEDVAEAPLGKTYEPRAAHADEYRAARDRQQQLYRAATGADTS
jgi:gluconokinase